MKKNLKKLLNYYDNKFDYYNFKHDENNVINYFIIS